MHFLYFGGGTGAKVILEHPEKKNLEPRLPLCSFVSLWISSVFIFVGLGYPFVRVSNSSFSTGTISKLYLGIY